MSEGFTARYAVRMPNGELYQRPGEQPQAEDYSMSSPMRDYYAMMGLLGGHATSQTAPAPSIFDNRKAAEALLAELQESARRVGVELWGGAVVQQLCTPFISGDPSAEFAEEIVAWVRENGGAL